MGSQFSEFDESGAKAGHAGRELLIAVLLVALPVIAVAALMMIRGQENEGVVAPSAYSMDPADRKFLNEPYRAGAVAGGMSAAAIDPADRKFFNEASSGVAGEMDLSAVDPADRKFYAPANLSRLTRDASSSEAVASPTAYWAGVNGAMPGISAFAIEAELTADSEAVTPFSTEIYWEMARRQQLKAEPVRAAPRWRTQPR
jgi:hypothetical protein